MNPKNHPKKLGGRPRKHPTPQDAVKAKKQSNQRRYRRNLQPQGPADFIAYEPPLHQNIPAETPSQTGLRVSLNIRIPQDSDTQRGDTQRNVPQSLRPNFVQPSEPDAELARQIQQVQIDEEEHNAEQEEYEAEVSQRLNEMHAMTAKIIPQPDDVNKAGAPSNLAILGLQAIERSGITAGVERANERGSRRSSFSKAASLDKPILLDNNSVSTSRASKKSADTQKLQKARTLSQTPSQRSSPSLQSSNRSSAKQSKSFPAQTNNLLSWMKSLPARAPTCNTPTPPVIQRSPSTALSPCLYPAKETVPPTPTQPTSQGTLPTASIPPIVPPIQAAAPPVTASTPTATSPLEPIERTAFKLAKQLRSFQGCTHEQHREADQLHQQHHQRPDVHSKCSSLQQITTIIRGQYNGGTPLPDVLSSTKMMKPADLRNVDCQGAFEGTSCFAAPEDIRTRDENLPKNLCLSQHYSTSNKNRRAEVTFDIDSICCFPSSLGIARRGINWFPKDHTILNIIADIHFGLKVPIYNSSGALSEKYVPLHKIPHYCFGTLIGIELPIFIFFPALHMESDYEHSTYLCKEDQQLWYDAVLSPALNKTIRCSNIMQHYPASAHIADVDSAAVAAESLARKESAREQLLRHTLQPQYLDPLWACILKTIEDNPGFQRFQGATLFINGKNTKLGYMDPSLTGAYARWENRWFEATDPQFYNNDRTFVDLAKQVTSEDSALPYDQIPDDHEAEVYLWRSCCLEAYSQTREVLNADGSRARGNPKRTKYSWAMMRDTMGQTMFAAPRGKESTDGLIYSQFYALIKGPFDTSKTYVFDNESLENLALDPGYIRALQQEGGSITFSKAVCEFGYLHGKRRAHANLIDNRWKSYGIREEHRISLTMMDEIYQQWREWDLYDDNEIDYSQYALPYYIIPTQELLGFLYAQINKYCFLFEYVRAHTAMTYSLPETMVMVIALRALRFCYSSNLLQRESLLYKDRWEQERNHKITVKEGLGMRDSMERYGLGWFLPKFNWAIWRLAPPHGENILVGNMLMHEEYKRRWKAVKDLRDVFIRFNQAESWYDRYNVEENPLLLRKWLEYLHVLNLEQFDTDIWKAMLKINKASPELAPAAMQQKGEFRFCYRGMKEMFSIDGVIGPPHFVMGNKMRFEKVSDLLYFLFIWDDKEKRRGWGSKPYRAILQKSVELVERRLGYRKSERWLFEFLHLVRLTHWILPYPSDIAFISSTKTSRSQGLRRRMMWFSAVYANPEKVELPVRSMPCTLFNILWAARQQTFGNGQNQRAWGTYQLIKACREQGLRIYGLEEGEEYWVVGKKSAGLKGFSPLWERSQPPKLLMLEQIKNKSLEELEELMVEWSRGERGNSQNEEDFSSKEGNGRQRSDKDNGVDENQDMQLEPGMVSGDATTGSGSIFVLSDQTSQ